jgi:two-component system sensor histidine kinase RegB
MQEAARINFLWLLRLRWGAMVGQIVTIFVVVLFFEIPLPLRLIAAILAIEGLSNAAFAIWAARGKAVEPWMLGAIMAVDVLLLTCLLYLSGGAFNPFSFLYLVHIALAAVVLSPRWTWALVGMSLICFGSLFLVPSWPEIAGGHAQLHSDHMHMHLQGMWVAFAVAAGFIVYFVQRVTRALADRELQLSEARDLTARNEKLASLATLAAGAAHELSTPLSTIAVAAKELEHQIARNGGSSDAVADAQLIREQVTRCREILVQMTADAGESMGEASEQVTLTRLLQEALGDLPDASKIELPGDSESGSQLLVVPRNPVAHAIRNVVKNAQEASSAGKVEIRTHRLAGECCIEVSDHGSGMSPEVLGRAGEPFFTTKDPGHGMGLGLFLSRAVFTRLGGRIELDSELGRGTTVRLFLPTDRPATDGATAGRVDRAA